MPIYCSHVVLILLLWSDIHLEMSCSKNTFDRKVLCSESIKLGVLVRFKLDKISKTRYSIAEVANHMVRGKIEFISFLFLF